MPQSITHNEWIIQPPPGVKFSVWQDGYLHIDFERGKEHLVKEWMEEYIAALDPDYVDPRVKVVMDQMKKQEAEKLLAEATAQPAMPAPPPVPPPNVRGAALLAKLTNKPMPQPIALPVDTINPCGMLKEGKQCKLQAGHQVNEDGTGHEF